MKKKILLLDYKNYDLLSLKKLEKKFIIIKKNFNTQKEFLSFLNKNKNKFYAVFTEIGIKINDKIVEKNLKNLKYIVTPTTGLNHINISKKNIFVLSLKNEKKFLKNITSTAELSWFLILALYRKSISAARDVTRGYWRPKHYIGKELYGKTLGVIGMGRLGKIISKFAIAFGMNVIFTDLKKNKYQKCKKTSLLKIFKNSDVISININYDEKYKNFINLKYFKMCEAKKPILINTSRGEIINEKDLVTALKKKYISGAGLDVLHDDSCWKNNVNKNSIIIKNQKKLKNLIITPHIGGYTQDAIYKTRKKITENFLKKDGHI